MIDYEAAFGCTREEFEERYGDTLHGFKRNTSSYSFLHEHGELTDEDRAKVDRAEATY